MRKYINVHVWDPIIHCQHAARLFHTTLYDRLISFVVICRQMWLDEYMTWKPEDHGNVEMIFIPSYKLWTPNLVILNS